MRVRTRGPKEGTCNICGAFGQLTDDHIPPKGASRLRQVDMMHLIDLLSAEKPRRSARFSQDGVKYRTICPDCNSGRLGTRYDPSLIELTASVHKYLSTRLYLPSSMDFPTKPNRVARSIVGHLLAHGLGQHRTGAAIGKLTDYVLDESAPFPNELEFYYWLYPYNDQVIIKGAGLSLDFTQNFASFLLLKFYPICFLILADRPNHWTIPYCRLDEILTPHIDDEGSMRLDFAALVPRRWPEAPVETGIVMLGEDATGALPRAS